VFFTKLVRSTSIIIAILTGIWHKGTVDACYVRPVMNLNEPLMPETPKERRRRVLKQTAVLVRHIDVSIEKAHAKLKAECSSTKKELLSRQISELEQFRYELECNTKRDLG
jgi:hypothetical protein